MERVVDWYWQHAQKRPQEWTLTAAELDGIMQAAERKRAIEKGKDGKACVAFWGPSQSGKSSLLAHYIDGDGRNENLALGWSGRVRFSTGRAGEADGYDVVFNPFNGGMDASGLVTRFYLPEEEGDDEWKRAPVELTLADDAQIMHAIAVGYRLECIESQNPWQLNEVRDATREPAAMAERGAYEFLRDVCDVCEAMAQENPRYREFRDGQLRGKILSSACTESIDKAKELGYRLLWDGESELTKLFELLLRERTRWMELIRQHNIPARIWATMEAAAILEDIGALEFLNVHKDTTEPNPRRRVDAMRGLRLDAVASRGIVLSCGKPEEGSWDTIDNLLNGIGTLQALTSEMRIPLRRTTAEGTRAFFDFLEKHDLLDMPGVTNRATGLQAGATNLIDLGEANQLELLTKMYKTGKTLSIIHAQAKKCNIDAFAVFVDLARAGGVARPAAIAEGLKAWLRPYGAENLDGVLPLKLYLNCSLFGRVATTAGAAATGGGFAPYVQKAEEIGLAGKRDVECFFTANQYAQCNGYDGVAGIFERDADFSAAFLHGRGREALNKLFEDGLGTDYMFGRLKVETDKTRRLAKYDEIERECGMRLRNILAHVLPDAAAMDAVARVRSVVTGVENKINAAVERGEADRVATFVKRLFDSDDAYFEMVPAMPGQKQRSDIRDFVARQIQRWTAARNDALAQDALVAEFVEEGTLRIFLEAVACADTGALADMVQNDFATHQQQFSRTFLRMALVNTFMTGAVERQALGAGEYTTLGAARMLVGPFLRRLDALAANANLTVQAAQRPNNLAGDNEIMEIARALGAV
ncbi:MAG: hypothetical protein IJ802_05145 [Kiritimatiellae bacterium]|nr:hypothetical protein [Kiritimatiellia bacterium]